MAPMSALAARKARQQQLQQQQQQQQPTDSPASNTRKAGLSKLAAVPSPSTPSRSTLKTVLSSTPGSVSRSVSFSKPSKEAKRSNSQLYTVGQEPQVVIPFLPTPEALTTPKPSTPKSFDTPKKQPLSSQKTTPKSTRSTAARSTPSKVTPARSTSTRSTPAQAAKSHSEATPSQTTPARSTRAKAVTKQHEASSSAKKSKVTPRKKSPTKKTPVKATPSRKRKVQEDEHHENQKEDADDDDDDDAEKTLEVIVSQLRSGKDSDDQEEDEKELLTKGKGKKSKSPKSAKRQKTNNGSHRQSWLPVDVHKATSRYFAALEKSNNKNRFIASNRTNEPSLATKQGDDYQEDQNGFVALDHDSEDEQYVSDDDEEDEEEEEEDDDDDDDSEDKDESANDIQDINGTDDQDSSSDEETGIVHENELKVERNLRPKKAQATNRKQKVNAIPSSPNQESASDLTDQEISPPAVIALPPAPPSLIPYSRFTPVAEGPQRNFIADSSSPSVAFASSLTIGLEQNETLSFVGIGLLTVLKGSIQVGGATLTAGALDTANMFVPITHPIPRISVSAPTTTTTTTMTPTAVDDANDNQTIQLDFGRFAAVVQIKNTDASIAQVGQICPLAGLHVFEVPSRVPTSTQVPRLEHLQLLLEPKQPQPSLKWSSTAYTSLAPVEIPSSWTSALEQLSQAVDTAARDPQEANIVAVVKGTKKVGKSTFSRMALEYLFTRNGQSQQKNSTSGVIRKVAFLELDLGQSDFGPPGMVSLYVFDTDQPSITLGPGWCQPRLATFSHFFGDVSPRDDPSLYVDAIASLFDRFRTEIQATERIPLIVNTQGWVKGLGADLSGRIDTILCPTHIYDVIIAGTVVPIPLPFRGPAYLDDTGAILAPGSTVTTIEGVPATFSTPSNHLPIESNGTGSGSNTISLSSSRLTAVDQRTLSTMAYFHATHLASCSFGSTSKFDFTKPLVAFHPLIVDITTGLEGGIHVLPLGSSVPDSLKLAALNSSIVAVMSVPLSSTQQSSTTIDPSSSSSATTTITTTPWHVSFSKPKPNPSDPNVHCLGLAIIRSIDPISFQLHLLTPIPFSILSKQPALALVKGIIDLPIWASLDLSLIQKARDGTLSKLKNCDLVGTPCFQVPYLDWPIETSTTSSSFLSTKKRKVRRNLMRKNQG